MATLQFIGGGRMATALVGGLIESGGRRASDIVVVEPVEERRRELEATHPGLATSASPADVADVVLAVKPDVAADACRSLRDTGVERLLSIAAGVRTADLEAWSGQGVRVVRAMPNTPALVGAGAAGMAPGEHATAADLDWAGEILGAVGVVEIVTEADLDAVTAVSGSGPAYLFYLAEAMNDAAVSLGLSPEVAERLVTATLVGSARLLADSVDGPGVLRSQVTSPGGTTAAAVGVLDEADVRGVFIAAIARAAQRAVELGDASAT
jgi:pyrroline-5-carboxylate reductase